MTYKHIEVEGGTLQVTYRGFLPRGQMECDQRKRVKVRVGC
jgi:hypothetical protein